MARVQSGQSLALALVLLAAVAAGLVQSFNGGQLLREKVRLSSALDAAAYSGALVQARGLNFLAYTNRALVAHQIAMAHAVTLASWAKFGDAQARQLARANPPASLIGGLFGPSHGQAYRSAAAAAGAGTHAAWPDGALARAFAEHDRIVHDVLVRAQATVQKTLAASRMQAMREVFAAHFPGAEAELDSSLLADTLPGFVVRYGGQARGRLKGMVEDAASRHGFLAPRNATRRALLPSEWRCPWLQHELRRRGATSLLDLGVWRSVDTESFHALRSNRWIGCYYREYPMGWGAAKGDPQQPDDDLPMSRIPPPILQMRISGVGYAGIRIGTCSTAMPTRSRIPMRCRSRSHGPDGGCPRLPRLRRPEGLRMARWPCGSPSVPSSLPQRWRPLMAKVRVPAQEGCGSAPSFPEMPWRRSQRRKPIFGGPILAATGARKGPVFSCRTGKRA